MWQSGSSAIPAAARGPAVALIDLAIECAKILQPANTAQAAGK